MNRIDLRQKRVQELSFIVFNNTYLVKRRLDKDFTDLLSDMFLYTDELLDFLNDAIYASLTV